MADSVKRRYRLMPKSIEEVQTLWVRIDEAGCWVWTGAIDHRGYGVASKGAAYRLAYTLAKGPIPEDMTVDHICFNPPCVNPDHLQLLTLAENSVRRRVVMRTHCIRGHEMTPENTYCAPNRPNWRTCRTCTRENPARRKARRESEASNV